jgi:hypothetical protein
MGTTPYCLFVMYILYSFFKLSYYLLLYNRQIRLDLLEYL